jgi:hypothetical protein
VTLGESRDIEFIPHPQLRPIWGEELSTFVDVIYGGEKVMVNIVLRYPDVDAISAICLNASGSTWGFNATGSNRAGLSLYTRAQTLVITPRYSGHPSVTINKAIPFMSEGAMLQFAWNKEFGLACSFFGSMASNGAVYTA